MQFLSKLEPPVYDELPDPSTIEGQLFVYNGQIYYSDGQEATNLSRFLDLEDTPSTYEGQANKVLVVKSDESGLEFRYVNEGTGSPGGESGTIQFNNNGSFDGIEQFMFDPDDEKLRYTTEDGEFSVHTGHYVPYDETDGATPFGTADSDFTTPEKAFDNNYNTAWVSSDASPVLGCDFEDKRPVITKYSLYRSNYVKGIGFVSDLYSPKSWRFEASNDNSNWVILQYIDSTMIRNNIVRTFEVDNAQGYRYYRIRVTEKYSNTVTITECKMFSEEKEYDTTLYISDGKIGMGKDNPDYKLELPNINNRLGQARANAWTTYSSIRWKENITEITDALEKVKQLNGVYFNWINSSVREVGLIAEDVGKVVPEIVEWEDDFEYAKALKYDRLVALLIQAIKEQQAIIDKLVEATGINLSGE